MDALTVLRSRRSIRQYENRAVPREALETIVDCGRLAASGRGVQPWEFVVVTEAGMRKRLAKITEYGAFLADAPAAIVCSAGRRSTIWKMGAMPPKTSCSPRRRSAWEVAG